MLVANLIVSSMLCCLIWIIQILHYPSFRFVDQKAFTHFEAFHTKSISLIVLPLMLTELAIAINLVFKNPGNYLFQMSLGLVLLMWFSTFFLSVPCHNLLQKNYDSQIIEKLIYTNWPRTLGWTLKLIFAVRFMKGVTYE